MAKKYPYDTSTAALLRPADNAVFFEQWEEADFRNPDLLCAEMSRLAYASRERVRTELIRAGFDAPGFIGSEEPAKREEFQGTQGFVARSGQSGVTVLAFRGTESTRFEDLITDSQTLQEDFRDGCRVHTGFLKAYTSVRAQVERLSSRVEGALLVTGHSLGAALATLVAADVPSATLITFGSPLVGDGRFAGLFLNRNVRRYVDCCDVVARVPPERFDQAHLDRLFTELADPGRFGPLARWLAHSALAASSMAIAGSFALLGLNPEFKHVSPRVYIRRTGQAAANLTEEQCLEDQERARADYRHDSDWMPLSQLKAECRALKKLAVGAAGPTDALAALRAFFRERLAAFPNPRVPLRDLADHAPINYLSALTGRG